MPSTIAPSDIDVLAFVIDVQGKLRESADLLEQAHRQAADLSLTLERFQPSRFGTALQGEWDWIVDYLSPNHAMSVFEIPNAMRAIDEFLELLGYAVKEDK